MNSVVFGGVGGSGIVGDILSDYCRESIEFPVSVCRTLRVPRFVGKRTLFIAISYSGETRETLTQLTHAKNRGARIIAVTSGGRLLSRAKSTRIPYLKISSNLPPRVALPELVAGTVYAMGSTNTMKNVPGLLAGVADSLQACVAKVKQSVPSRVNKAKQMAQALVDKFPLLIGDEAYASVLKRFKNQLSENGKVPAVYFTLPESYHNDVEGLSSLAKLTHPQPILLRTRDEIELQRRPLTQLIRLFKDLDFPAAIEFEGFGREKLSELLTAITFADYVSVYLASLRSIDPAALKHIPSFRRITSGK